MGKRDDVPKDYPGFVEVIMVENGYLVREPDYSRERFGGHHRVWVFANATSMSDWFASFPARGKFMP